MSNVKKNSAVIQIGKGVYEIEPLAAENLRTHEDIPAETPANPDAREIPPQKPEVNIADEYLAVSEADGEAPAAAPEKPAFTPVTNPLKLAIDSGQIELSELDPNERLEAENAKNKRDRLSRNAGVDASSLIFGFRKGDSPFLLVSSIVNFAVYAAWFVIYIVCVVCREVMLGQAVTQMALSGTENYVVEISSPLFTVLKLMLYALPVIMLVWTVAVAVVSKKKKELCDNVFIIGAYAADFLAGMVAVIDIFAVRIIFA